MHALKFQLHGGAGEEDEDVPHSATQETHQTPRAFIFKKRNGSKYGNGVCEPQDNAFQLSHSNGKTASRIENHKSEENMPPPPLLGDATTPSDGAKEGPSEVTENTTMSQKLVEIKPRQREQEDASRSFRTSLDKSAFDGVPPAEVYDPSWNTQPLRCEAGQLRLHTTGGDSDHSMGPILPMALALQSSADLEEDDDTEDEENPSGASPPCIEELQVSEEATSSPRGKYSLGALGGAMSFLNRRKKEGTMPLIPLFATREAPDEVAELLRYMLREYFDSDVINVKGSEIRVRVRVNEGKQNLSEECALVLTTQCVDSMCSVAVRRSKADRGRASPQALRNFCLTLCSRYKQASPSNMVTIDCDDETRV